MTPYGPIDTNESNISRDTGHSVNHPQIFEHLIQDNMVNLYIQTNTPTNIPKNAKEFSTGAFQAPAFQPKNSDMNEVQEPAIVYGPSSSSGISGSKSRSK